MARTLNHQKQPRPVSFLMQPPLLTDDMSVTVSQTNASVIRYIPRGILSSTVLYQSWKAVYEGKSTFSFAFW